MAPKLPTKILSIVDLKPDFYQSLDNFTRRATFYQSLDNFTRRATSLLTSVEMALKMNAIESPAKEMMQKEAAQLRAALFGEV